MTPEPKMNQTESMTDDQNLNVDVKEEKTAMAESAELSDADLTEVAGGIKLLEGLDLGW